MEFWNWLLNEASKDDKNPHLKIVSLKVWLQKKQRDWEIKQNNIYKQRKIWAKKK